MIKATNGLELSSPPERPDPREMLKAVAGARSQIHSGEIEFEVTHYEFARPLDGTNHVRLRVRFDGEKRRCDWSEFQYGRVLFGPDAERLTDAKRQELKLDLAAAVGSGLLTRIENDHRQAYDGEVFMEYLAEDGQPRGARIEDPIEVASEYSFSPRVLGLTSSLSARDTVESCLGHSPSASIELLGQESVEGVAAWHIRVTERQRRRDYWIDAQNHTRVIKQEYNGNAVISKYDPTNRCDPLPSQVKLIRFWGVERSRSETDFFCRSARFNIPVDPTSWTLAGLHMPVGTDVGDGRLNKSIGWWNGARLSDSLPPRQQEMKPRTPPNLNKLLELADHDPKSLFAAHACFSVASLLKLEADEGSNEQATTEAERLFERVIDDYGQVESAGVKLADQAKLEVSELRRVGVGKVAQEIEGEDLGGRKLKLSDYRGKVVVLSFWATWCPPCMEMLPDEKRLVEQMAGKPFMMIGINSDTEPMKAKAVLQREKVTWPSFRDGGREGLLATAWHVKSWPTVYVLDRNGVIRYRNVRGQALAQAVETLIRSSQ